MQSNMPRSVASEFHMPTNSRRRSHRSESTAFRAKLERSRQNARECRARKKIRYQYMEELIQSHEKAIYALREELNTVCLYNNFSQHKHTYRHHFIGHFPDVRTVNP